MTERILLVPAELIDPVDQLSHNTRRRCIAALNAWDTGVYTRLVLTGGIFLPERRQTKSAALTMKEWLVERGVGEEHILLEDRSLDTYENIAFALSVLTREGIADAPITVATQFQHALRFAITFFLAHGRFVSIAPVRQPEMGWKEWVMEWLVLIPYHLVDWRGTWFVARNNRERRSARTWNP